MVESEAEQLVSGMLDLDPEVVALCPQGFTVDLREGVLLYTPEQRKAAEVKYRKVPGPSLYTTDFFVELDGNRRRALEVKLDSFQGEDEYVAKLITARPIIERFGLDLWVVIVPADKRHPIWTNVPLMVQGALRRDLWPCETVLKQIKSIATTGANKANHFLSPLGLSINHFPMLVVSGALKADALASHFKADTYAEAAYGDLGHLNLIRRLRR